MKTVVLEEPGRFEMTDTPEPPGEAGHALVRVRRVGICGTDLHAYGGRQPFFEYPRIIGHELGVEIVDVGANDLGLAVGDLCAVEPYLECGSCIACRRGRTNCCAHLKVLGVHTDGGMREVISVPFNKLHRSTTLSLDQLALVETLGIGHHAVSRAQIEAGEHVLVIGAGPIGLTAVAFAQEAGGRVSVMDVNARRLAFCQEALGVEDIIDANDGPDARLADITSGEGPTAVFDATGNPASMNAAFKYPAATGKLVFVSLAQTDVTFNDPEFHRRELTVYATRNSTAADFRRIIGLLEDGSVDTRSWITHRSGIDEMIDAF
ncbi:alcohol dehydrogenase, partial [Candidatus Poribacteria bacterium]|nr:alcohol dehydrogenase [Candidatus Poribacteria bacterium]